MRERGRQASPAAGPCSHGAAAVAQGAADAEVMVRRLSIAPSVTCQLCGGLLRDATAITDCLHAFCRECIVEEFTDKNINHCPKCGIDLGCNPLKKLRADHSLRHIRSLIFPAKRRKMEEISSLQPPFVLLPTEDERAVAVEIAEYVLACCLSRDPSFRLEMVLEGVVAADEAEQRALRETALRVAQMMVRVDDAGGDGVDA